MGLLSEIQKLIEEHASSSIQKERIVLIREQAQVLEKKIAESDAENAQLKRRVAELEGQLSQVSVDEEFVEHRGALFKRKGQTGYHVAVYCPRCRSSTSSPDNEIPYFCRCGWMADFTRRDLEQIMHELPVRGG